MIVPIKIPPYKLNSEVETSELSLYAVLQRSEKQQVNKQVCNANLANQNLDAIFGKVLIATPNKKLLRKLQFSKVTFYVLPQRSEEAQLINKFATQTWQIKTLTLSSGKVLIATSIKPR
jgi:hypothetical protein